MSAQKRKIEAKVHHSKIVTLPPVRDYSTGGGHLPGDTLVEGDKKVVTKKWQGYPPVNLNILGKPLTPIREVIEPRVLGTAEYTPRVVLPNMLYAKFLRTPHPRSNITRLDTSKAEKMPGVQAIVSHRNAPSNNPMPVELRLQGDYVAIVAAESEDLAEDAVAAIEVEYEVLPSVGTVAEAMGEGPELLEGGGNLYKTLKPGEPNYDPNATAAFRHGDVEKGFAESDIVKEFTYRFEGARIAPIQQQSCLAKWDGDQLTFWGMGQGIYPNRAALARYVGIPERNIRYINKYNGCTFGGTGISGSGSGFPYWGHIAHLAKETGRPVKALLTKEEEIVHVAIKSEVVSNFKVGLKRDGKIHALKWDMHGAVGYDEAVGAGGGSLATSINTQNALELYTANTPHWERLSYLYKSNTPAQGCNRSCTQQEIKWAWGIMIDELAESVGMDPVQFRLLNIAKPGDKLTSDYEEGFKTTLESTTVDGKAYIGYDAFASVEILEEAAKAIGWDKRNPKPGGMSGRFKRGLGMDISQHHGGHVNYREGEAGFRAAPTNKRAQVEIDADGYVALRVALPDSGTNHGTGMAMLVAEMLGFTSIDRFKYIWGASDVAPQAGAWLAGNAAATNGGAALVAAEKMRNDLFRRASLVLGVDQSQLETRDGVIWLKGDPQRRVTFAALAKAAGGVVNIEGQTGGSIRGIAKGIGACFVEVEVDTWTGAFRVVRVVESHDAGKMINPLIAEADMEGQFVQNFQVATQAIPWDKEFPGQMHYNMGFLSMRIPTIMEYPEEISNIFVESHEPRWFYGYKGFTETTVGCIPSAIANAVYNATGVRIKDHPVTQEKIIMGLKALSA
jgi:CO/xanthine dehydrogenase Mo-binding subunit